MFTRRRRFTASKLLAIAALSCVFVLIRPVAGQSDEQFPYLAAVTADDVHIRCGAALSYYPFGKAKTGDLVKVIGHKSYQRSNWARVVTLGATFETFFGYIKHSKADTSRFRLEPDGKTGVTLGRTDVVAPNLNTSFDPKDSWKPIIQLAANEVLTVFGTFDAEGETVHKVVLPPNAVGWIETAYLRPASPSETAAWEATLAKAGLADLAEMKPSPATVRGVGDDVGSRILARVGPVVPGLVTPVPSDEPSGTALTPQAEPAAGAAPTIPPVLTERVVRRSPAKVRAEARLSDLESAYRTLQGEPIEIAEVQPLRHLYIDLADQTQDIPSVSEYAAARAEQLELWAQIQQRRLDLAILRARVRMTAEEAQAARMAIESGADYVAVGRLAASTIYDGRRLPKLLRIQDPGTGRTVAYLHKDDAFDMVGMLGQLVGIVGEKSYDGGLRLNLVKPRRIDILAPRH